MHVKRAVLEPVRTHAEVSVRAAAKEAALALAKDTADNSDGRRFLVRGSLLSYYIEKYGIGERVWKKDELKRLR